MALQHFPGGSISFDFPQSFSLDDIQLITLSNTITHVNSHIDYGQFAIISASNSKKLHQNTHMVNKKLTKNIV